MVEAALNAGGVHLITVPVDYSENIRVLVDELRKAMPADPQKTSSINTDQGHTDGDGGDQGEKTNG
jgi:hypothetical protein